MNCLELRAVFLALMHLFPVFGKHHIIVQDGQHGGSVHINRQGGSRSRTLDRLARRLLPLNPGQIPFLKGSSRPGILNLADDFLSRQKLRPGRVDVEPSDSSPNLGSVWQRGSGPLCFTGVVPMPTLVLPKYPGALGIDAFAHP